MPHSPSLRDRTDREGLGWTNSENELSLGHRGQAVSSIRRLCSRQPPLPSPLVSCGEGRVPASKVPPLTSLQT